MLWRTLVVLASILVFPAYGQGDSKGMEATAWEADGTNRWKAYIVSNGVSLVQMTLKGDVVTFRVVQKCKAGNKIEETTLEWSAGDTVGQQRDCEGRATKHDGMPKFLEEEVFKPYPPEVAKVLRPKPKIKVPSRPSIEDMHRVQPTHEARRASAPGFFFAPQKERGRH
jgi:hypothetical protein